MQHKHRRFWMGTLLTCLAVATLVLPAHAGVRVSIGIGAPVYPAPVVIAPPPAVVYPAPVVVTRPPVVVVPPPVVYRGPRVIAGGYYGHRHHHWRHRHHKHRW
jgi:hypothetical protein